jgi:hypothetical protein
MHTGARECRVQAVAGESRTTVKVRLIDVHNLHAATIVFNGMAFSNIGTTRQVPLQFQLRRSSVKWSP